MTARTDGVKESLVKGVRVLEPVDPAYEQNTKLDREEERVREESLGIYTGFRSRVELAGPDGAARSGDGHVRSTWRSGPSH
jgi:hypothetical protein